MFCTFLLVLLLAVLADARRFPEEPDKYASHPRAKRGVLCYGDLGCFDNGPPFQNEYRPISFQPESPDEIGTQFVLFTPTQKTAGIHIPATNLSEVGSTDFSANRPTKIIIHGWQETTLREKYLTMKDVLLTEGDYNVFLVDWQNGAKKLYGQSTANTRVVGAQIAQLIKRLQDTKGARPEDMHIIGHSLGSHTAGYAGALTPGLARITGLDPAEPYFQHTDPVVRLDPTDAAFVDVIHTDAAHFYSIDLGLGMSQPAGHVDFYPNGGLEQPGCTADVSDFFDDIVSVVGCNHERSVKLFNDTIKAGQCPYRAYQCENADDFNNGKCIPCNGTGCGIVGMRADQVKPAGGATNVKYFFNTGEKAPFCRFHYKVTLTFSSGKGEEQRGNLYVKLTGSVASAGMTQVTEGPIYIYTGHAYTYIVTSPADLGDIVKVAFRWVQDATILDWNTWYFFSTPAVYLNAVQVYSGEAQKGVSFCAGDVKVKSKSEVSVNNKC